MLQLWCLVSLPMHQPLDFGASQVKKRRMDVRMFANNTHSNTIESPSEPAKIFARFVDNNIRSVRRDEAEKVFKTANSRHPNLEFTTEHEKNSELAFLDLLVIRSQNKMSTSWYKKPSDTGVYVSH